ncbi:MAG: hypothetical protein QOI39_2669 [Mycobacterium sp.]|jgi:hypothetical protein|nr:hypothetical protein [Mycobacterium sp.]
MVIRLASRTRGWTAEPPYLVGRAAMVMRCVSRRAEGFVLTQDLDVNPTGMCDMSQPLAVRQSRAIPVD